jgi:ankyrin repeat protein
VGQLKVRAVLERLPNTLEETYERVLKDIKEDNREDARRLFHCLAVAVRPLRVEELAEILTFDFDTTQGGLPKFHADRRPKDQEEHILSLCSSMITVVNTRGSRVVQFSHLSVKEFLTSNRLASSAGPLTSYHILPGLAHTILAQVCLGLLLHVDGNDDNKSVKGSPLAEYAARHWIAHVQFEDVASSVEGGMRSLFDPNRPHFATWIGLYDIDAESAGTLPSEIPSSLYYSALLGFRGLVRHISVTHPEQVNAIGGSFGFPLVAALCRNHFAVAELLLEHGGRVDVRDQRQQTALHKTINRPDKVDLEAVRFLLERGANVNARRDDLWTPLHLAANIAEVSVARMLLERHANVNSRNYDGQTPLHLLSRREASQDEDNNGSEIAKLLLERGANVNEKDRDKATPLHLASYNKKLEIVRVLLDHGANANAEKDGGETPLQLALRGNPDDHKDGAGVAQLILESSAGAYVRDNYDIPTSDFMCCFGEKTGQVLHVGGGKSEPDDNLDRTVFWLWMEGEYSLALKN